MSAKPAEAAPATDKPKGKGKKGLVIALVAVLVLAAGGGGGAWFFLKKKGHDTTAAKEEQPAHEEEAPAKHGAAPVYLAMENMVLNLADPGGERVAQIGITLEVESEKTVEKIKVLMPKVRSGVLMLVSQRTSDELLRRDGKEKLATDIRAEVSEVLGYEVESSRPARSSKARGDDGDDEDPPPRRRKRAAYSPVQGVLFSAFIVQ